MTGAGPAPVGWQAAGHLLSAGPSPLWYATRATGVISLILLTATVVLGVVGSAGVSSPHWPRVVTAGLHRNLSLLVVGFVAAHVATTVLDSYAPVGWAAAFVPLASAYRPVWAGLGAVASDLLLAVVLTSLLRARLGYRGWRAVHWLAYACWPVALWHGLGTGTDSRLGWLLVLDAACVAAVVCAVAWRVSFSQGVAGRVPAMAGTAALVLVTIIFVLAGPLQHGWARRAGTPAYLLGAAQPTAPSGPGASAPGASGPRASGPRASGPRAAGLSAALPSDASFTGTVTQRPGPAAGQVTITVAARTSGPRPASLRIILQGSPIGQGISMSSGSVQVGPAGTASSYQGPVVLLQGHRIAAALRAASGSALRAQLTLFIQGSAAHGRLILRTAGDE